MISILDRLNKSKTFCIMPWIHTATQTDGSVQLCCVADPFKELNLNNLTWEEVWNSNQYKDARLKMLANKPVNQCKNCYKEEQSGITSHRQNENAVWSNEYSPLKIHEIRNMVNNTHEDGSIDTGIISVDFRLGNTCNLKCIMCRPHDSSKWVSDAKILANSLTSEAKWDWQHKSSIVIEKFEWYKNQKFWDSFYESSHNIKDLIFAGGEPMLIKQHKELIKHLVKTGHSKNVEIRYHTNGTIVDDELIELWETFKKVHIMISLDGPELINSYIRYPSDWNEIVKNIHIYDQIPYNNILLNFNCTIQAINIVYLPEFVEWISSQNFKRIGQHVHANKDEAELFNSLHVGLAHWPQYLCVKVLPMKTKLLIEKKLTDFMLLHPTNKHIQSWRSLIDFMMSEDWSDLLDQTIDYLKTLDSMRSVKFDEIYTLFKK